MLFVVFCLLMLLFVYCLCVVYVLFVCCLLAVARCLLLVVSGSSCVARCCSLFVACVVFWVVGVWVVCCFRCLLVSVCFFVSLVVA